MAYKRISPIPVVEGGTGAQTVTGVVIGNGASAMTGNAITQHDILVGGASNAITSVAPSSTSGVPVISQGASADPAFGTAVVAGGGTGLTSTTAYAVLCGGTTSTGALQSIASVGSSGQVLTSNGASALPTFQPVASGSSIMMLGAYAGGQLTATGFKNWITPFATGVNGVQANAEFVAPFSGTAKNLYVYCGVNASTAGTTITLNKNGSNTALVVTITALTTGTFSDTTHTVSFSTGDLLQWECGQSTTGIISGASISMEYTSP